VYAVSGGIPWTEEERRFVRTWMLDDMGNCFASYDKAHLSSRLGEDEIYSPGDGPGIFNIKEAACSALSGHDILFPEFCRQISLAGTQIFFVSANWPKEFGAMWEPVIRSVAFTNQCYVVACNGSGNSAVISPYGEIIAAMGAEEGVLSVSLKLSEVSRCRKNIPLDRDRRGELYAIFP
jgi:predicted amidohydrolase